MYPNSNVLIETKKDVSCISMNVWWSQKNTVESKKIETIFASFSPRRFSPSSRETQESVKNFELEQKSLHDAGRGGERERKKLKKFSACQAASTISISKLLSLFRKSRSRRGVLYDAIFNGEIGFLHWEWGGK